MKLYYQPEGVWFGDCMPFGKDDTFYLYHQRDTRRPGPFGEPFGWDLSTTKDFVRYEDKGVAIPRGADDEQDQFIFAGSVFEAEGQYHAFYTGYNRDYVGTNKPSQVLMHAVSDDLKHWTKDPDKLQLDPQPGYNPDDWRDPFVLRDEAKGEYLLILGARKEESGQTVNGCTVQFTSKDLKNWTFGGEFWNPAIYTMHEMPDLFKIGEWWYLIISEYSDKNKIVYRMSKSLQGPWLAPTDDAFDGRAYYAARSFALKGQRILFGWVPTRENEEDKGEFQWGGTFMAHELFQRPDGSLGVKPPQTVVDFFKDSSPLPDLYLKTVDSREERVLARHCGETFRFEADLVFESGTRAFTLKFLENEATGEGYQFVFPIGENRYYFEKNPNWPWFQCLNIGLERPIVLQPGENYHLQLIVDDTIATLYVNGVALNTRMYTRPGEAISLSVTDGALRTENAILVK